MNKLKAALFQKIKHMCEKYQKMGKKRKLLRQFNYYLYEKSFSFVLVSVTIGSFLIVLNFLPIEVTESSDLNENSSNEDFALKSFEELLPPEVSTQIFDVEQITVDDIIATEGSRHDKVKTNSEL